MDQRLDNENYDYEKSLTRVIFPIIRYVFLIVYRRRAIIHHSYPMGPRFPFPYRRLNCVRPGVFKRMSAATRVSDLMGA